MMKIRGKFILFIIAIIFLLYLNYKAIDYCYQNWNVPNFKNTDSAGTCLGFLFFEVIAIVITGIVYLYDAEFYINLNFKRKKS